MAKSNQSSKPRAAKTSSKKTARPVKPKTDLVKAAPPTTEFDPEILFDQPASKWPLRLGIGLGLAVIVLTGFELLHAGRIYPGVYANGANLGGKSRAEAIATMKQTADEYNRELIPIRFENTVARISPQKLGLAYNFEAAADQAVEVGRHGTVLTRVKQQAKALLGRRSDVTAYTYQFGKLTPYLLHYDDDLRQPAQDAKLNFESQQVTIAPAQAGRRLDFGRLTLLIQESMGRGSLEPIDAPVSNILPAIDTVGLESVKDQAADYVGQPITVKYGDQSNTIDSSQLVNWLAMSRSLQRSFDQTNQITDFYPVTQPVKLSLSETAVKNYVSEIAKKTDQPGQDAALTIQDGRVTIFRPSRDGATLDQPGAVTAITGSLKQTQHREVTLVIKVTKPTVREDSLNDLGIKELISEGQTFFPGSPQTRLTNIRAGASKFNGILLKPDETFSFGSILGDVGPETGYVPELVILVDHEEKQYGGGLCQVSSTAYRAALLGGLPIVERHNHSFAVSYYTAPFGVPGVDATIYYPQVDFKFKNDTGAYILIQTVLEGTTLKFDFYGTKTKSGRIRGPEFVSGTTDSTKPSHTIFYRDILDLAGNVTKTDAINTFYKSSKDFPINKEFN